MTMAAAASRFMVSVRRFMMLLMMKRLNIRAARTVAGARPDTIAPYTGGGDYESLSGSDIDALKYETEQEIGYIRESVPDLFEE